MNEQEPIKGLINWLKESVTVKLMFIAVLILILMIPTSMINSLITERSSRQKDVVRDIADKWSGSQLIKGPVLIIPYRRTVNYTDVNQKELTKEIIENLYVLPENLRIKANVEPQVLHRGMFDGVVYNSNVNVSGNFAKADLAVFSLNPDQLLLDKAQLTFSVSDRKGLKNNPVLTAAGIQLSAQPTFLNKDLFNDGLQANINLSSIMDGAFTFNLSLDLKGSQDFRFLHLGKTTEAEVSGKWPTPSFEGRYLPDTRNVNASGFSAQWRMLYYNRPFPQQWIGDNTLLNNKSKQDDASFGVKLLLPVDQYQKITRTSKYAILIILLTFISLFLTEVIRKQRVHVFNYVLIGAAMVIYYTLLLSFSEQVGYNVAYLIASVSTIALVSVFIASLIKNRKAAAMFAAILSMFYAFIFIIIQLEDYALLVGSLALFAIVATLMYFSRSINWDEK